MKETLIDGNVDAPVLAVIETLLVDKYGHEHVWGRNQLEKGWKAGFQLASYQRDFDLLWNLVDAVSPEEPPDNGTTDIVLLWDGIPKSAKAMLDDDAPVHSWLTPYDWCVALSQHAMCGKAKLRFFIVDLGEGPVDSFAERIMSQNPSLFPWLRIYGFGAERNEERVAAASVTVGNGTSTLISPPLGFAELLADLGITRSVDFLPMAAATVEKRSGMLRSIWANELTKAERRHTISNAIAPLLLAAELELAGLSQAESQVPLDKRESVRKFGILLSSLKLLPPKQQRDSSIAQLTSPLGENFVHDDIFGRFRSLRFFLVDDKAEQYAPLILQLLGGQIQKAATESVAATEAVFSGRKYSLKWATTPDRLLDWIKSFARPVSAESINIIGKSQPGLEDFDILFLDLRLFNLDSILGRDRQKEVIRELGAFYAAHKELERYAVLSEIIDHLTDDPDLVIENLLLLPLMLSAIDPSLPIVIFSSTHQREIIDRLSSFPNIVVSFAKPLVSGYSDSQANPVEHIDGLRRAIVEALVLHEKRVVWDRLALFTLGRPPVFILTSNRNMAAPKIGYELAPGAGSGMNICNLFENDLDHQLPPLNSVLRLFASYYVQYVLMERYHDFASIPSECIEGFCTPIQLLSNPLYEDVRVKLVARIPGRNDPSEIWRAKQEAMSRAPTQWKRMSVLEALKNCRNRKVHGYGASALVAIDQAGRSETSDEHRAVAILQFLTLLDFLQCRTFNDGRRVPIRAEIRAKLRTKYEDKISRQEWPDAENFFANKLTSVTVIDWVDFAVYSLLDAQCDAPEYFDPCTYVAIGLLSDKVFRTRPASAGTTATSGRTGQEIINAEFGTVKWFKQTENRGIITRDSDGLDIFVSLKTVTEAGLSSLEPAQRVRFCIDKHSKYKIQAVKIQIA